MKKIISIVMLVAVLCMGCRMEAKVVKETFTYNPTLDLKLDRYTLEGDTASARPVIIFAFGGGFSAGTRDEPRYREYFDFMANLGYVVCSIDYRTALKGFRPTGPDMMQEFGTGLARAITEATTDFLTATGYILANSGQWRVNPSKIIASGSSAGAITALQSEHTIVTNTGAFLPEGFNYAAVVSFAGALFSQSAPQGLQQFCPTMLFQGNADANVPYNVLTLGDMGLYGSDYLATQLKENGIDGAFYTIMGADHSMAVSPMHDNLYDIAGFLHHVLSGEPVQFAWTTVTRPDTPPYRTDFSMMDYIRNNMPE